MSIRGGYSSQRSENHGQPQIGDLFTGAVGTKLAASFYVLGN
jgi:hypothetical protein